MLISTSLLARVTVPTLLALKISCGAGEDDNLTTLDTGTATSGSEASDTTAASTPTTTTADPGTGTEVGSTGPATMATSSGDLPSTSGSSEGGESTGGLPDGACQSDADCDEGNFESCFTGDDVNCGPCQLDPMECLQDRDCGEGLCELVPIDCGCDGPVSHVCAPKCSSDADCLDDKVCDLESGRCELVSCTAGAVCPPQFDCVPDAGGDDCVRHPCDSDAECTDGVCVEGGCFVDYGVCMPPGA